MMKLTAQLSQNGGRTAAGNAGGLALDLTGMGMAMVMELGDVSSTLHPIPYIVHYF